jgi:hypothetical protein
MAQQQLDLKRKAIEGKKDIDVAIEERNALTTGS